MRILVLTRFYLNGQSTHVFALCKGLVQQGFRPYLVASNLQHQDYIRWLRSNRIPFSNKMQVPFLHRLIKEKKIELIHTHSVHTLELALELGETYRIPVVATCHYLNFPLMDSLAKATKIITISQEMKAKLKLPPKKTVVIENGVDTSLTRPWGKNNSHRTAVILARITPKKKPALNEITQLMLEYDWRILSIGNWQPKTNKIISLGWQVNIAPFLRKADLIIGTGRAIREGMVAGCAACVLGDYFDGLITPDNVEQLRNYNFSGRAFKIALPDRSLNNTFQMLSKQEELQNLQQFCYTYGKKHFSLKDMIQQTITVYQSCLDYSSSNF